MEFFVQQAVLDAGVKIIFPVIRGMDNTVESDEWKAYRTRKLHELYEQYAELDVHADPVLEGFNILHDDTGVKRRKNIPASENLIKLLKKGQGEMFYINTAVDIYNLLSLESKLALGAHNIDKVDGAVYRRHRAVRAAGSDGACAGSAPRVLLLRRQQRGAVPP